MTPDLQAEKGSTLLIAMVMLIVLTLFAISAITLSNTNLSIVSNMQARHEAIAAGKQAIEQIMSRNFTADPAAETIPVDINNDGNPDYTVEVAVPACISSLPLTNDQLSPTDPKDQPCISSIVIKDAVGAAQSWCFSQQWEITATVIDNRSGAQVVQRQGASLRVPAGTTCI
jgi:Tfp pilus assembly protein PilX